MIYLDNAATSRFKPKTVLDALNYDIIHSANSGRAGHSDAVEKSLKIAKCREKILQVLGADDNYSVIFTKNCTEALNLAIFGAIKGGEKVVTSKNEHNSVLRPLYHLANINKIKLTVLEQNQEHKLNLDDIKESAKGADIFVFGGASNVTGATLDIEEVGKIAKDNNVLLIVDAAQSVPYINPNVETNGIAMLACPGHKGLHGVQGTGFLVVRNDIELSPLLFGGTGTHSQELLPSLELPDSFEAGTMFSGGISALLEGIKWTYSRINFIKNHIDRLSKNLILGLADIDAVITVRELARMIKKNGIMFNDLPDDSFDAPFGLGSGAGTIFGATGGVMEAALRTAYETLTHEELKNLDFTDVRGVEGIKEATYTIAGNVIKVAVASGTANAKKLLDMVKNGEKQYDFIEIMACPGGCVNGGGQPIQPAYVRNFTDVRAARAAGLYADDKALPVRKSHENPDIKRIYEEFFGKPNSHLAHEILHTAYTVRKKY